ncbi:MAG: acyl-CoA mutase large subunit family protein, partial [Actinobacteria bacterium]|nr:acyl-CoA mutase large subunit family protein [Actinomycetota bacterium]
LRTQQVLAYETAVTKAVDPLAGSYYVEDLTNRMEAAIAKKLAEVEERGGLIECIKHGWLEAEINEARYKNQADLDSGRRTLVGVNQFTLSAEEDPPPKIHKIQADVWGERRATYLKEYRETRDQAAWAEAMGQIERAWKAGENMVPVLMHAYKNKVTAGEAHEAMRQAQGWSFRSNAAATD